MTADGATRPGIVLLIRHAATHAIGVTLTGRTEGIALSLDGYRQARALADTLASLDIAAVYSSPLQRAIETAQPLAAARRLPVQIEDALNEVDFGEWTGLTFDDLARRDDWRTYNSRRGSAVVPGGETPQQTQSRIVAAISDLAARHRDQIVVAVTHAELVRYLLLYARARQLDDWMHVVVEPASISVVERLHKHGSITYALPPSSLVDCGLRRSRGNDRLPETNAR